MTDYASKATDLDHLQAQTLALSLQLMREPSVTPTDLDCQNILAERLTTSALIVSFYTLVKKAQQDAKQKSKTYGQSVKVVGRRRRPYYVLQDIPMSCPRAMSANGLIRHLSLLSKMAYCMGGVPQT